MRTRVAAALLVSLLGGTLPLLASPAHAAPYRFCSPSQDPDCYFIFIVDKQLFRVAQDDIPSVIAKGKEVCQEMSMDTGRYPVINWATRFGAQNGTAGSNGIDRNALAFASFAAAAYCPWIRQ